MILRLVTAATEPTRQLAWLKIRAALQTLHDDATDLVTRAKWAEVITRHEGARASAGLPRWPDHWLADLDALFALQEGQPRVQVATAVNGGWMALPGQQVLLGMALAVGVPAPGIRAVVSHVG